MTFSENYTIVQIVLSYVPLNNKHKKTGIETRTLHFASATKIHCCLLLKLFQPLNIEC